MACFAVINVSQGSVEHTQDAMDVQYPFNCKFTKKSSREKNVNRLRFDRIMVMSLLPRF